MFFSNLESKIDIQNYLDLTELYAFEEKCCLIRTHAKYYL